MKHDTDKQEALKEHLQRFPGMNYTFVEGVDGRTNPFLRNSYKNRNIIGEEHHSFTDGELGVLASHRMIMENCMLHTESSEPYWILDPCGFYTFFHLKRRLKEMLLSFIRRMVSLILHFSAMIVS